jgi:DNA-binding NarL/FixJ family response regulator
MTSRDGILQIWVTFEDPATGEGMLDVLAADPGVQAELRPWPSASTRRGPDVIVASTDPPESIGALRQQFEASARRLAVVLISAESNVDAARRNIVGGADAVLLAADAPSALGAAVRAAHSGLLVLSPALSHAIARPSLTTREKQILAMVVMGMSNQEIADRLVVAPSTVKSHLFSAYRRLGVRTRKEAAALITDPDRGLGSGILGLTGS